jgi:hypothetical protein
MYVNVYAWFIGRGVGAEAPKAPPWIRHWNHLDNLNQTTQEWSLDGHLQNFFFFYADRKSKMSATAEHVLTLDPMGKCSNAFFSETTNMIKAKLYMNVHWVVLYTL